MEGRKLLHVHLVYIIMRANPARFGPARLWSAKNGSGWAGLAPIKRLDIVTHPVLGRADLSFFYFF